MFLIKTSIFLLGTAGTFIFIGIQIIVSICFDTPKSIIQLINGRSSIGNIIRAMKRENKIKSVHPFGLLYYLWFIGVSPYEQNKGIGSNLLTDVINEAASQKRIICLETSTVKNIPWYEKHGFTVYQELDFGYKLFCMKREY